MNNKTIAMLASSLFLLGSMAIPSTAADGIPELAIPIVMPSPVSEFLDDQPIEAMDFVYGSNLYSCGMEVTYLYQFCDVETSDGPAGNQYQWYCPTTEGDCHQTRGSAHLKLHDGWMGSIYDNVVWSWTVDYDAGDPKTTYWGGESGHDVDWISLSAGQTVAMNARGEDPSGNMAGGANIS